MMRLSSFFKNNPSSIGRIYIIIISGLVFASGVGRYRSFLFISVFFAIYTLLLINKTDLSWYKRLYAPCIIGAIYLDYVRGPFYPVFSYNNLMMSFVIYFSAKYLFESFFKKNIETLTGGAIFTWCPACGIEYDEFTAHCNNCGYSSRDAASAISTSQPEETIIERVKLGFWSNSSLYKDGSLIECTELWITKYDVFIYNKQGHKRGFESKIKVPLASISDVRVEERDHHGLRMQIVVFESDGHFYELFQIHKRQLSQLVSLVGLLRGEKHSEN